MGEGIVEIRLKYPPETILSEVQAQTGHVVEAVKVVDRDPEVLHLWIYTRSAFVLVSLKNLGTQALIDITSLPQPMDKGLPVRVAAFDLDQSPLPVPFVTAPSSSLERAALRTLRRGDVAEAHELAQDAYQVEQNSGFYARMLREIAEVHAQRGQNFSPDFDLNRIPVQGGDDIFAWAALCIFIGRTNDAHELLQRLSSRARAQFDLHVKLYEAEISRRILAPTPSFEELQNLLSEGRKLDGDFYEKASVLAAASAISTGHPADALTLLADSKSANAMIVRGEAAFITGDSTLATTSFSSLRRHPLYGPFARLRLVDLGYYKSTQREDRILHDLNRREEGDVPAMLARARLLERGQLGRGLEQTLVAMDHLVAIGPPQVKADAEFRTARLLVNAGRGLDAIEALRRAVDQSSDPSARRTIIQFLGYALERSIAQAERADRPYELVKLIEAREELLSFHEDKIGLVFRIARAARRVGRTDIALHYLLNAAEIDPKDVRPVLLAELATTYLENGDLTRAQTVLSYAAENRLAPRSYELSLAKAEVLEAAGEVIPAIESYVTASELAKRISARVEALGAAAALALRHDHIPLAKKALDEVIRANHRYSTTDANARIDLATLRLLEGQADGAVELLTPIRTSSSTYGTPEDLVAQATYFEGTALLESGKNDEAVQTWRSRNQTTSFWDRLSRAAADAISGGTASAQLAEAVVKPTTP